MPEDLIDGKYFVFGVNLPWLDGKYDHDLGKNQAMGRSFRAYDEPGCRANLDSYLKDISLMGARVVRLWIFERFEGLLFDEDLQVKGIDDGMLDNLTDALQLARKHDLLLYLCLHDTWGVSAHAQEHLPLLNAMVSNERARRSFVENALKPLIYDLGLDRERIFAIDIMNEPEGLYPSIWRGEIDWEDILAFIGHCADAIHEVSSLRVSTGFQHYQTIMDNRDHLGGLDFYDYHEYNDEGMLIPYENLDLEKPCIVGECGQKSERYEDEIQRRALEGFMRNSWDQGYAGCLIWYYNCRGYDESDKDARYSLIRSDGSWRKACNSLIRFSRKHRKKMLP